MARSSSNLQSSPISNDAASNPSQLRWIFGFIVLGCLLRLVWADDMKWKADEIWMYEVARDVVTGKQPWPWLGMGNGAGFLNPGLSIWCFIAIAWVSPDPIHMVRWVQVSNIAAIGLFLWFTLRYIAKSEQPVWLWGLAIMSVNPLAIHFSRALWAQDILPFVGFFVFAGHWFRHLRWGAFVWGLVGTLIGQIHMSGFFWQASLVLITIHLGMNSKAHSENPLKRVKEILLSFLQSFMGLGYEPRNLFRGGKQTQWWFWLLGTTIGLFPMIPWIQQIGGTAATIARPSWAEILTPNFPLHWLLSSWGLNLEYDLGPEFWRSFLLEPRLFGYPSFAAAIALLFLAVSAIAAIVRWWRSRRKTTGLALEPNEIVPYLWAGGVIMPILLLLARVRVPGHYLIVLYPFVHLWVAVLERGRVRSLIAICSAQLFVSVCFLVFIHVHNGGPEAFYGTVYRLRTH
jgi:hypothetical protein